MNRKVILFHLHEAAEELTRTITDLEGGGYDVEAFRVAMGHLYHHLNTAWNGRDQTDLQFKKCTDEDFQRFRKVPANSELNLD